MQAEEGRPRQRRSARERIPSGVQRCRDRPRARSRACRGQGGTDRGESEALERPQGAEDDETHLPRWGTPSAGGVLCRDEPQTPPLSLPAAECLRFPATVSAVSRDVFGLYRRRFLSCRRRPRVVRGGASRQLSGSHGNAWGLREITPAGRRPREVAAFRRQATYCTEDASITWSVAALTSIARWTILRPSFSESRRGTARRPRWNNDSMKRFHLAAMHTQSRDPCELPQSLTGSDVASGWN